MTKETFRIADSAIASIKEPVRQEKIRQELIDLLLDLDRKFESVLSLRGKYEDDDCREAEEKRPMMRSTVSSPQLCMYGQGYQEKLARRRSFRQPARLVHKDHVVHDDHDGNDDDEDAFCSLDSPKLQCGKKRSQQVRPTDTNNKESNAASAKLDVAPLSPVDTMINWSQEGDEEEEDDDQLWLLLEDMDNDPSSKRRCSNFF